MTQNIQIVYLGSHVNGNHKQGENKWHAFMHSSGSGLGLSSASLPVGRLLPRSSSSSKDKKMESKEPVFGSQMERAQWEKEQRDKKESTQPERSESEDVRTQDDGDNTGAAATGD